MAASGAAELAERLREAVALRPIAHRGVEITVTCSFGVADVQDGETAIVELADKALYRAKHQGRNRVEIAASGRVVAASSA